jgi:hypothetical protein
MTALVHLVRRANGLEPFEAFLASYDRHDAGLEHELVLLFKGFDSVAELAPYRALAGARVSGELQVPDDGLDLAAYMTAAQELSHDRLCFVNSFSTIEAPDWLRLLSSGLDRPGVGVAGATGSWGSHRSFALFLLRLPNGYRGALENGDAVASALRSTGAARELGLVQRLYRAARDIPRVLIGFPGFPAPHVRTNAFLIDRERLLSLRVGTLRNKSESYRFEGGTRGLTGQIRQAGLDALVVGRDGDPLAPDRWPDADIFWQRRQRDLLVADNQTRAYEHGTPAQRDALARYAWGARAQSE